MSCSSSPPVSTDHEEEDKGRGVLRGAKRAVGAAAAGRRDGHGSDNDSQGGHGLNQNLDCCGHGLGRIIGCYVVMTGPSRQTVGYCRLKVTKM